MWRVAGISEPPSANGQPLSAGALRPLAPAYAGERLARPRPAAARLPPHPPLSSPSWTPPRPRAPPSFLPDGALVAAQAATAIPPHTPLSLACPLPKARPSPAGVFWGCPRTSLDGVSHPNHRKRLRWPISSPRDLCSPGYQATPKNSLAFGRAGRAARAVLRRLFDWLRSSLFSYSG